jgi:hypothetical protein
MAPFIPTIYRRYKYQPIFFSRSTKAYLLWRSPHPGQPLHDVRCGHQDHRHHHVQLAEPRRPDRGREAPREELGRTAVLDPQPRDRRELRIRCAQRRSGNRRREERQGPPERDVDAKGVDHLDRIDSPVFEPPSGLLGSAPFDVNNDNYDLNSVSFVS